MIIPKYASLNYEIVPWDDAKVHVFSPVAKYGIGVFEGIRGYWSEDEQKIYLFRLADHLRRLEDGEKAMRFSRPESCDAIERQIIDLIRANEFRETVHVRVMTYVDGPNEMSATGPIGTAITVVPRPLPAALTQGVSAQVSSWQRISDRSMPARIKCNANYHNGRIATLQAIADGYDVPILLNDRGSVAETPSACVFIVRNGVLVTPAVTDDILESITRDTIIEIAAADLGIEVRERRIDRSELYSADEIFLAGTGAEITPVTSIDRIQVGDGRPGAIARKLQDAYFDVVLNRSERYRRWCLPVEA